MNNTPVVAVYCYERKYDLGEVRLPFVEPNIVM